MRILTYLILFAILSSCSQKIIQSTKTVEKDSVHVDTVKTRKIVKTKGDSTGLKFNISEVKDQEENFVVASESTIKKDSVIFHRTSRKGGVTTSVDITRKGNVKISCKEDSLRTIIEQQRITIQKFKDITTIQTNTVVCPPKTKWQSFCEWVTWIFIALISGGLIYRFRKVLPPPINWIP